LSGTMNFVYFGNDHIEFAGNDLTNAVNIRGSRDIVFEGNHFHDGPDRARSTPARPAACGQ
jgi:hypothetical protein